jgi:hypothetical protein
MGNKSPWSKSTRIESLMDHHLSFPGYAVGARKSLARFSLFVREAIALMPKPYGDVARRYYIEGGGKRIDPLTGRAAEGDGRFHDNLMAARAMMQFLLNVFSHPDAVERMKEIIYGNYTGTEKAGADRE